MRMASILDDVATAADWIARALSSSGDRADFSPASMWEIDRFFDEHSQNGRARPGGLLAQNLGSRMFALGCYIGEVVRRAGGGAWKGDDSDPAIEINVALVLPNKVTAWPIQRAMKRFKNGPEDGIAAWSEALGVSPGPQPPAPASAGGGLFRKP